MTFVVPFDASDLAEAALARAVEFGAALDERVVVVSAVPDGNASYARERDWIGPGDAFEVDAVVATLHERVAAIAPNAEFRYELVGRRATAGQIANRIREFARDVGASVVFVGSENAGRIVASLGSVGKNVAAEDAYDVLIVRNRSPSTVDAVAESSPFDTPKSEFY
jgi:nucleotide-binding universal stress UspA family protein